MSDTPHIWAVSNGWEGPFQHEEVLVVAASLEEAAAIAELAFGAVTQPVCRAKMRIADLGPAESGLIGTPRRSGESYAAAGVDIERRCGVD